VTPNPHFVLDADFPEPLRARTHSRCGAVFVKIAFGRVAGADPLRPRALRAFEEFFYSRARDVYPQYDFARMTDGGYGQALALD
jgi:hypothetical protein